MNYGDLKSHFEAVLNRSDITPALTTTFIDQGIARIQRQLRTPLNENKATYTISSVTSNITLPADFLEIISLYANEYELQRTTMKKYREMQARSYTGKPQFFVREQQDILLFPTPTSGEITLYYYAEFPALVNNTDTNNLTLVASDLVTYAALTYSSDYFLDERSELFETKFNQFLGELQEQANDQELNGGIQALRPTYEYGDY
jgi:hypothetical protein